jgi:uncharacterized protein YndB with AHSA1/START domain
MQNSRTFKVTTPSDREVMMTRVFDAPRKLVFKALTTPELLKRWLTGSPGWTMEVCEIDLRVGGTYRFVWRGRDGIQMGMGGVYREVVPPERYVGTELFDEAWYPGGAIVTTSLAEQDGKTTLTLTVLYESKETRDAVLKTPMEQGVAMGYDKLEALLGEL